jgi:ATP-dependent DNA ligase
MLRISCLRRQVGTTDSTAPGTCCDLSRSELGKLQSPTARRLLPSKAVRAQRPEGVVGKRRDSPYEPGKRTRNGFVPASRRRVYEKLRPLVTPECPFANLPETRKARWGEALTVEKMKKCVWVQPKVVAQIEFLEWTDTDHLRHSRFAGLRDDKEAGLVVKEKSI